MIADTTAITRRDLKDAFMMSSNYYYSLMETVHLLYLPEDAEAYRLLHVAIIVKIEYLQHL